MEITVKQSNHLRVTAVFMMLCLHLFNTNYKGLFDSFIFIKQQPLVFYISRFCDACVPIFAFVSGYGLYYKYEKDAGSFAKGNFKRLKKLYLNLWIVILIFPVLVGWLLHHPGMPGSFSKLFLNLTAINVSYSFIWWYFTTYVLVVISAPLLFYWTQKYNEWLVLLISFVIYLVAFYFRVYKTDIFTNQLLHWFHFQGARYGLIQFQFLLGAVALKNKWNHRFGVVFESLKYPTLVAVILIILLFVFRAFVANFIVSPFTALAFILLWNQISLGEFMTKFLDFFAPHTTNIWLCHSFFYVTFFKDFIFGARFPLLIFILLLFCSLVASYIINLFYNRLQTYIS
ncbi:acyltransferase family protein [Chryseobacterium sp. SC28]|uniref:acyltransferase family protein n=1 Tax=Chryseobacterium sp. SC28 TaxID=2268028 RepID=UPI000F64CE6E|nr:acyltransferase family protein [Chryseobacterium sp. SC28]RRQ45854.1 hypothetical protein DTW91_08015 [Chryseobacterium sp. SC28]